VSVFRAVLTYNSGYYQSSCLLFETQRFGDRILSAVRRDREIGSDDWVQLSSFYLKEETDIVVVRFIHCFCSEF
jgi:hypothetical protein